MSVSKSIFHEIKVVIFDGCGLMFLELKKMAICPEHIVVYWFWIMLNWSAGVVEYWRGICKF
jgi:hypothetical protein